MLTASVTRAPTDLKLSHAAVVVVKVRRVLHVETLLDPNRTDADKALVL